VNVKCDLADKNGVRSADPLAFRGCAIQESCLLAEEEIDFFLNCKVHFIIAKIFLVKFCGVT